MSIRRLHYFQHVPFEGLGCIQTWAFEKEHRVTATKFYQADPLPDLAEMDWLIVMGGPMSVQDEAEHPWLKDEKDFIRQAIDAGKTVVGICLGSQLIAEVLGARVYKNRYKEIGWFDVTRTAQPSHFLNKIEQSFSVFHWHGDTFDLPTGAQHLLQSEACRNQAFLYEEKVLGLQFHFEVTEESLRAMIDHSRNELIQDRYVQTAEEILAHTNLIAENNKRFYVLLNQLAQHS